MRRPQLSEEVASYLRQSIMAGDYAPGASVRAEAVGDTLEVSATPVREALHTLRAEGFLDLIPRKGFIVAPLVGDDIRDIFEAHALIAGELAARAAERASNEEVAVLGEIHERLLRAASQGNTDELELVNHEFHRSLYRLSGSKRLRWALNNFNKYVPRAFYSQIDGWAETTASDHGEIFLAVKAHDATAARICMAQHIRNSGEKLAEYFDARHPVEEGLEARVS